MRLEANACGLPSPMWMYRWSKAKEPDVTKARSVTIVALTRILFVPDDVRIGTITQPNPALHPTAAAESLEAAGER